MAISVTCPKCGTAFRVNDKYAGTRRRCLECTARIQVPRYDPVAEPAVDIGGGSASDAADKQRAPGPGAESQGRIRFACNHCGRNIKVRGTDAGRRFRCPDCRTRLRVPPALPSVVDDKPDLVPSVPVPDSELSPSENLGNTASPTSGTEAPGPMEELLDDVVPVSRETPGSEIQAARSAEAEKRQRRLTRPVSAQSKASKGNGKGFSIRLVVIMVLVGGLMTTFFRSVPYLLREFRNASATSGRSAGANPKFARYEAYHERKGDLVALFQSVRNLDDSVRLAPQIASLTAETVEFENQLNAQRYSEFELSTPRQYEQADRAMDSRLQQAANRVKNIPGAPDVFAEEFRRRGLPVPGDP